MKKCNENIEVWFADKLFHKDCGKDASFKITIINKNEEDTVCYRCQTHKNYLCMDLANMNKEYIVDVLK